MNLESMPIKKSPAVITQDFEMEDFDFKPITSGLGFHQPKVNEIKPTMVEKTIMTTPMQVKALKPDMNVYQNDLSMFYGQATAAAETLKTEKIEESKIVSIKVASSAHRVSAYAIDLMFISSILGIVLTVMARTISVDLMELISNYPNEITPLIVTLFTGFYVIYFSIFENSAGSTLGKNLFGLSVVDTDNEPLSFMTLVFRSLVSLANFLSLGLFSYFDLQNKITSSKVIRND